MIDVINKVLSLFMGFKFYKRNRLWEFLDY